ncbi:MAG: hypothetical protein HDT25_01750 [Ruminococcus sp.]|nr:hypothetical protein [Ruminococcus sp.]
MIVDSYYVFGSDNMWGICLDPSVCGGKLFQRAVEYDNSDSGTVQILQPITGIKISSDKIKIADKPPAFVYNELVSTVYSPNIIGKIENIIWHFKNNDYNYYISADDIKISKRYYSDDLIKL